MIPHLIRSFAQHRGTRGVHFYDDSSCEFLHWNNIFSYLEAMQLPEEFGDKLIESVANYDPDAEFIAVSASKNQLSIEIFRAMSV